MNNTAAAHVFPPVAPNNQQLIMVNNNPRPRRTRRQTVLSLSFWFALVLGLFAVMNVVFNTGHIQIFDFNNNNSILERLQVFSEGMGAAGNSTDSDNDENNNSPQHEYDDDDNVDTDQDNEDNFQLAGLSCERYGGPSDEESKEMVYWEDIPSDSQFVSPLKDPNGERQFLTFEPDAGGWNNIRMAMETVLALAFAMGRTLVLPPEKEMYLLKQSTGKHGKQRDTFSFSHFFHMEAIHKEHVGLDIITMEEYLEQEAMAGHLIHQDTGKVSFPPNNVTNWNGRKDIHILFGWLRKVSHHTLSSWHPDDCIAVFPESRDTNNIKLFQEMENTILANKPQITEFVGKPVPIDGTTMERLRENWAERNRMCIYDTILQESKYLHFPVDAKIKARLLVHFYAFVFFQNYKHDLYMKRFIRDHVRYIDEIQCAAARVVSAVRKHAKQTNMTNTLGVFDAFHVRRGDFQYKATRVDAPILLEMAQKKIPQHSTLYMATDERDKSFFDPLKEYYDLVFLDDFHDEALVGINSNYYGMIDQLVATRSRTFFGCWFSTFTGYIDRIRGYHADQEQTAGYEMGIHNSWFYALPDRFDHMQEYYPVKKSFFAREFPTSWRLIDSTLETS